jgi:hypothetical protein
MSVPPKLENNWRFKSIESLVKKNYGSVPDDESSIVQRLWRLRGVPINEFQVDDVRFMIIQGVGLPYLLMEAIDLLKVNLLTEGNYYEGDLLNAVLQIGETQWKQHPWYWHEVDTLIRDRLDHLRTVEPRLAIDSFYKSRPG